MTMIFWRLGCRVRWEDGDGGGVDLGWIGSKRGVAAPACGGRGPAMGMYSCEHVQVAREFQRGEVQRRNGKKEGKNGRGLADRSFARGVRARRRCRRRCRQQGGFVATAAMAMQHEDGDIEVLSMAAEREQRD